MRCRSEDRIRSLTGPAADAEIEPVHSTGRSTVSLGGRLRSTAARIIGRMLIAVATWPTTPPSVLRRFEPGEDEYGPGHRGVDLAAAPGDPVRAALSGKVAFVGSVAGIPVVSLEHSNGLRTTYEPVTSPLRPGASVAEGQVIGAVAPSTGHCGGVPACLHWGVLTAGKYLDPADLFGTPLLMPLDRSDSRVAGAGNRGTGAGVPVLAGIGAGLVALVVRRRR